MRSLIEKNQMLGKGDDYVNNLDIIDNIPHKEQIAERLEFISFGISNIFLTL